MPYWLRFLAGAAAISALVLWIFGVDKTTVISILAVVLGASPSVIRKTPRLYLLYRRAAYFLKNSETTWDVGLRFHGAFTNEAVASFVDTLVRTRPEETKRLESAEGRFLLRYQRVFTVELLLLHDVIDGDFRSGEPFDTLTATFFDQVVSYRRATAMLEKSVLPLIEQIRNAFKPDRATYTLRIRFEGSNPFFGMYVQQLRGDLIDDFHFEFHLPSAPEGEYVRVNRADIVVVAQSPDRFRQAARTGLTFTGVSA